MKTSIYTRHRFHPDIIRRAVWMYFRFNLSFRDIEELMLEQGVDVSYKTCLLYTSPSPRDATLSRMPSSA